MPVVGEYLPPGAEPEPCCDGCASPEQQRERRRRGAALVAAALARGGVGRSSSAGAGLRGLGAEDHLIWWPGDIKALVEQTNSEIWTLAQDYSRAIASGALDHATLASFKVFFNEWEKYRNGLSVFSYLSGGTVATVQGYRSRAAGWRQTLINSGGRATTPAPTGLPGQGPQASSTVKWIAGAAIALAAGYAVGQVAGIIPRRRTTNPRRRRQA